MYIIWVTMNTTNCKDVKRSKILLMYNKIFLEIRSYALDFMHLTSQMFVLCVKAPLTMLVCPIILVEFLGSFVVGWILILILSFEFLVCILGKNPVRRTRTAANFARRHDLLVNYGSNEM